MVRAVVSVPVTRAVVTRVALVVERGGRVRVAGRGVRLVELVERGGAAVDGLGRCAHRCGAEESGVSTLLRSSADAEDRK